MYEGFKLWHLTGHEQELLGGGDVKLHGMSQVVVKADSGGTVEDNVCTGEKLLLVLLANSQVVLIEIRINSSDLLMHVWTNVFDFFK